MRKCHERNSNQPYLSINSIVLQMVVMFDFGKDEVMVKQKHLKVRCFRGRVAFALHPSFHNELTASFLESQVLCKTY